MYVTHVTLNVLVAPLKKKGKNTGVINLNNTFYVTQYLHRVISSVWNHNENPTKVVHIFYLYKVSDVCVYFPHDSPFANAQ
jgi:hypothetical protein